jgi:preprotein translocase subunit SecG
MSKLNIEDFAKLHRLYNLRIWCWCLGVVSFLLALLVFPHATRNPGAMAMSAFSAYVEVAWMAWLVIPMLVLGVIFVICGLVITWKIKHNVVIKENDSKSNVA